MNGPLESAGHREDSARLGPAAAVFLAIGMEPNDLVMGVSINGNSRAYRYADVAEVGIVNDRIVDVPVVVFVNSDTREVNVYLATSPDRDGVGSVYGRGDIGPTQGQPPGETGVRVVVRLGLGGLLSELAFLPVPASPRVDGGPFDRPVARS